MAGTDEELSTGAPAPAPVSDEPTPVDELDGGAAPHPGTDEQETAGQAPAETERPTDEATAKKWDKDKQERDQAKAEERKRKEAERDATILQLREEGKANRELLQQVLAAIATGKPVAAAADSPAVAPVADELDEEAKLLAEAREANEGTGRYKDSGPDPYAANRLNTAAHEKRIERERKDRETVKRRQQEQQNLSAEETAWRKKMREAHPDIPLTRILTARQVAWDKAEEEGYSGDGQRTRMRQLLEQSLKAVKKKDTSTAGQRAGSESSAPPGTETAPEDAGARREPVQPNEAAGVIAAALLAG